MALLGAIVGAIAGFAIGILFVEVIFANNQSWPDVVPFVLAILGGLAGRQAVRKIRSGASRPNLG
jgi:hypothetical protein